MRYVYCPKCGAKLSERPAGDDGNVPFCEACNKYWFDTFADASIIMVVNELTVSILCNELQKIEELTTIEKIPNRAQHPANNIKKTNTKTNPV